MFVVSGVLQSEEEDKQCSKIVEGKYSLKRSWKSEKKILVFHFCGISFFLIQLIRSMKGLPSFGVTVYDNVNGWSPCTLYA